MLLPRREHRTEPMLKTLPNSNVCGREHKEQQNRNTALGSPKLGRLREESVESFSKLSQTRSFAEESIKRNATETPLKALPNSNV